MTSHLVADDSAHVSLPEMPLMQRQENFQAGRHFVWLIMYQIFKQCALNFGNSIAKLTLSEKGFQAGEKQGDLVQAWTTAYGWAVWRDNGGPRQDHNDSWATEFLAIKQGQRILRWERRRMMFMAAACELRVLQCLFGHAETAIMVQDTPIGAICYTTPSLSWLQTMYSRALNTTYFAMKPVDQWNWKMMTNESEWKLHAVEKRESYKLMKMHKVPERLWSITKDRDDQNFIDDCLADAMEMHAQKKRRMQERPDAQEAEQQRHAEDNENPTRNMLSLLEGIPVNRLTENDLWKQVRIYKDFFSKLEPEFRAITEIKVGTANGKVVMFFYETTDDNIEPPGGAPASYELTAWDGIKLLHDTINSVHKKIVEKDREPSGGSQNVAGATLFVRGPRRNQEALGPEGWTTQEELDLMRTEEREHRLEMGATEVEATSGTSRRSRPVPQAAATPQHTESSDEEDLQRRIEEEAQRDLEDVDDTDHSKCTATRHGIMSWDPVDGWTPCMTCEEKKDREHQDLVDADQARLHAPERKPDAAKKVMNNANANRNNPISLAELEQQIKAYHLYMDTLSSEDKESFPTERFETDLDSCNKLIARMLSDETSGSSNQVTVTMRRASMLPENAIEIMRNNIRNHEEATRAKNMETHSTDKHEGSGKIVSIGDLNRQILIYADYKDSLAPEHRKFFPDYAFEGGGMGTKSSPGQVIAWIVTRKKHEGPGIPMHFTSTWHTIDPAKAISIMSRNIRECEKTIRALKGAQSIAEPESSPAGTSSSSSSSSSSSPPQANNFLWTEEEKRKWTPEEFAALQKARAEYWADACEEPREY